MTEIPATEERSATLTALVERLQFFFSDTNLRNDIWMQRELETHQDQMIEINKLLRFNTIKKISEDKSLIVEACEKAGHMLKLNDDKSMVGRVNKFDRVAVSKIDNVPLTILLENLPITEDSKTEKQRYGTSVVEIKEAIEKHKGCEGVKVSLVRFRYDRKFNRDSELSYKESFPLGSAFVEFETSDMQTQVLQALERVPTKDGDDDTDKKDEAAADTMKVSVAEIVIGGNTLTLKPLKQFLEEKRKNSKADKKDKGNKRNREEEKLSAPSVDEEEVKVDIKWEKGCVIKMDGIPEGSDRESIRDALNKVIEDTDDIYIDFSRGQENGAIRFNKPNEMISSIVEKLLSGEIKIKENQVKSAVLLEGKTEEDYWNNFIEFKKNQLKQRLSEKKNRNYNGRKKRRGGRN